MRKILFIPHTTANVKTRTIELAKQFTDDYEVYVLEKSQRCSISFGLSLGNLLYVVKEMLKKPKIRKSNKITYIDLPKVVLPLRLLTKYNEYKLQKFIDEFDINVVINASFYLYSVRASGIRYIYDLVDDHVDNVSSKKTIFAKLMAKQIGKFIEHEIKKAGTVLVVSEALREIVKKRYTRNAIVISNGADVEKYRTVESKTIERLRKELNLVDKYVIGYIGNLKEEYTGVRFLIKFFAELNRVNKQVVLLLVGPCNPEHKKQFSNANILFLGSRPPEEMPLYFNLIDLGVLPFVVSPFTDNALPLKIIEYTAAKKPVISTPLKEVINLNFPNIFFAEQNVQKWITMFEQLQQFEWKEKWSQYILEYDWKKLAEKVKGLLNENSHCA